MRGAVATEEPRIILRDAADIKRVSLRLLTHWRLPRADFRIDSLPPLASQRAQDRFTRLHEGCNCVIGELLGAAMLLGGSFMVWKSVDGWIGMGWVVFAAVWIGLIGKLIELAWVRVRLLLVLAALQRRIAAGGEPAGANEAVSPISVQPFRRALNAEDDPVVLRPPVERRVARTSPRRPSVLLREAADIDRLVLRVATRWRLPRIEIRTDALPPLEVQRAQVRVVRFSGPASLLPAAFFATAILLGGLLNVIWTESEAWFYSTRPDWWLLGLDWSDVQPVVIAALTAGLVGVAIEVIWKRARLVLVLRNLRGQLEGAVDAGRRM
jgi:hypothetical protein